MPERTPMTEGALARFNASQRQAEQDEREAAKKAARESADLEPDKTPGKEKQVSGDDQSPTKDGDGDGDGDGAPPVIPEVRRQQVLNLLDNKVTDVLGSLSELSDDELDLIEQAEADGNTRKTVMIGIAEERERRAALAGQSGEPEVADNDNAGDE